MVNRWFNCEGLMDNINIIYPHVQKGVIKKWLPCTAFNGTNFFHPSQHPAMLLSIHFIIEIYINMWDIILHYKKIMEINRKKIMSILSGLIKVHFHSSICCYKYLQKSHMSALMYILCICLAKKQYGRVCTMGPRCTSCSCFSDSISCFFLTETDYFPKIY